MKPQLKQLDQQVMVITGATSGIGLTTTRAAVKKGAKVVLAARSEEALQTLTNEINNAGGEAAYVVADVSRLHDVQAIARKAEAEFGGFDTWVNNAGVSIYGRILDVSDDDNRRLFETNFWGVINGSRVAVEHFRKQGKRGTALINIGSALSDRAIPLQGMYCASKHAVKGFTDSLRMELEEEGLPISVTLIKPAAIDTPYKNHAKNYLAVEPENPPPVYAPEVVAEAILYAAENPIRDVFAGGGGKFFSLLGNYAPGLVDKVMEWTLFKIQQTDQPKRNHEDNGLHKPTQDLQERGGYSGHVAESSVYTKASLHPAATVLLSTGVVIALASVLRPAMTTRSRRGIAKLWR